MVLFGQISVAMFDWPWSGIHFADGLVIGLVLARQARTRSPRRFWTIGVGLLVLWEIYERTVQYLDIHAHQAIAPFKHFVHNYAFRPETTVNLIGDLTIGPLGIFVGLIIIRVIQRRRF